MTVFLDAVLGGMTALAASSLGVFVVNVVRGYAFARSPRAACAHARDFLVTCQDCGHDIGVVDSKVVVVSDRGHCSDCTYCNPAVIEVEEPAEKVQS